MRKARGRDRDTMHASVKIAAAAASGGETGRANVLGCVKSALSRIPGLPPVVRRALQPV